jgi:tetratricopeptide (TPR) repeat protein
LSLSNLQRLHRARHRKLVRFILLCCASVVLVPSFSVAQQIPSAAPSQAILPSVPQIVTPTPEALRQSFTPNGAAAVDIRGVEAQGYGRIVLTMSKPLKVSVSINNGIGVIAFDAPVAISTERLQTQLPNYINTVRRDPDRRAIRLAMPRKYTVSKLEAGEKIFIDFLPENWVGPPPTVPNDVIQELARRAREAEQKLRDSTPTTFLKEKPLVLRVGRQPNYLRLSIQKSTVSYPSVTEDGMGKALMVFDDQVRMDLSVLLSDSEGFISDLDVTKSPNQTKVEFVLDQGVTIKTHDEGDAFAIDFVRGNASSQVIDPLALLQNSALKMNEQNAASSPVQNPEVETATKSGDASQAGSGEVQKENTSSQLENANQSEVSKSEEASALTAPKESRPEGLESGEGDSLKIQNPKDPKVDVTQTVNQTQLRFKSDIPAAAAIFQRAEVVWLVFDSVKPWEMPSMVQLETVIESVDDSTVDGIRVLRLTLKKPALLSASVENNDWIVSLGDNVDLGAQSISLARRIKPNGQTAVGASFVGVDRVLKLKDPVVGDDIHVVMSYGPARSLQKIQRYVEFRALPTAHGLALLPQVHDLQIRATLKDVTIERPQGLTLSSIDGGAQNAALVPEKKTSRDPLFDKEDWGFEISAPFPKREQELMMKAAMSEGLERAEAQARLARFYLIRGHYPEALGVVNVILESSPDLARMPAALALKAAALAMMHRSEEAMHMISTYGLDPRPEVAIWRTIAEVDAGRYAQARQIASNADLLASNLPPLLKARFYGAAAKAALEGKDYADAQRFVDGLRSLPATDQPKARLELLAARVAEGFERHGEAMEAYRASLAGKPSAAGAEARYRAASLRFRLGQMSRLDMFRELEQTSTFWRGDETELLTMAHLSRLYAEDRRWRDAFNTMKRMLEANPGAEVVRDLQLEMARNFEKLFLEGEADAMPTLEALSLYYDYKELTPVGRAGDEIIRRIADRLVDADLLDQAIALLEHQVRHRLTGAARAQIAARLGVIYLAAERPNDTLKILRETRLSDLPAELRRSRLILEARALSETGRMGLALELLENVKTSEVARMMADILWRAKRWQEAGEALEKVLGQKWQGTDPLTDLDRSDLMRSAIAYALAEDRIGLDRLRGKFTPKMADSADARAFDIVTMQSSRESADFRQVAGKVSSVNTLEGFLADYRLRFPDAPNVKLRDKKVDPAKAVAPSTVQTPASVSGPTAGEPAPASSTPQKPNAPAGS